MPHTAGLYYEVHGPADAPPLILSSGLGGSAGYWAPNLPALSARHRVIAYDQRGTGRSERAVAGVLDIAAMAEDIAALMDALAVPRATIVGHALGGMIGIALALVAPARVAGLVIINGWAALDPHSARCFDTRLALLRGSGPAAYLHAQPLFLYPPAWISAHGDLLAEEAAHQLAGFPGAEMVERRIAAVRAFAPGSALAQVSAPTLVVVAEDDMLVPADRSAALADLLPNATHVRMPRGGHACNVTYPREFEAAMLRWLATQEH